MPSCSPLKPEQYFQLNWALEEGRQQLTGQEEKSKARNRRKIDKHW